jgi:(2Fe-2S) ferredoxin
VSYYRHHVFFCCNQRTDGRPSCLEHGATEMRDYCKKKIKEKGLAGVGKVRVNQAGCLDRCSLGPVLVVYPDETWYTFVDEHDIDEIVEEHLVHGRPVERLRLPATGGKLSD